jgi:hypothetical protein
MSDTINKEINEIVSVIGSISETKILDNTIVTKHGTKKVSTLKCEVHPDSLSLGDLGNSLENFTISLYMDLNDTCDKIMSFEGSVYSTVSNKRYTMKSKHIDIGEMQSTLQALIKYSLKYDSISPDLKKVA